MVSYFFATICIVLGLVVPWLFGGTITWSIIDSNNVEQASDYRFFRSNSTIQSYVYKLTIPIYITTHRSFTVFPNDCIKAVYVNGVFYEWLHGNLCDTWNGIELDAIGWYLHTWLNEVLVSIDQNGYSKAFFIKPSIHDPIRMASFICLWLGFLLLLYNWFFSKKNGSGYFLFDTNKKFSRLVLIFMVMYIVGWIFIVRSEFTQRSFDQTGHLDYFKLLLRWDRNPPSAMCRQCYHPNTYYRFHTFIYYIGNFFHWEEPFDLIRVVTFFVWRIGILYAYKLIYSIVYARQWNYFHFILCILLFSFWPLQFYFGARISNEVRNHALSYIIIYYSRLAYDNFQSNNESGWLKNTSISLTLVASGLLVKTNSFIRGPSAIIWLFLYCCSFWLSWFFKKIWGIRVWIIKMVFICSVFVLLSLGLAKMKWVHTIIDNMDRINTGNSVAQYPLLTAFTTFSVDQYIHSKDMWTSKDSIETKSFRGFLSKSMILWEFVPIQTKNTIIVEYLMMSSFAIICLTLLSLLVYGRRDIFLLVWWIAPIVAMMANRAVNQYWSAMHYRLILPHIIFTSLILCVSLWYYKHKLKWVPYLIAVVCIVLFVLCSFMYSIPPYF